MPDQNTLNAFATADTFCMYLTLQGNWLQTYTTDGLGTMGECFTGKLACGRDTDRIGTPKGLTTEHEEGAPPLQGSHTDIYYHALGMPATANHRNLKSWTILFCLCPIGILCGHYSRFYTVLAEILSQSSTEYIVFANQTCQISGLVKHVEAFQPLLYPR